MNYLCVTKQDKMYQAQLVEVKETIIYLKEGIVVEKPETEQACMAHAIFGDTKVMRTETVIERWNLKTKKEANQRFWKFCEDSKIDSRNYFVVFTD